MNMQSEAKRKEKKRGYYPIVLTRRHYLELGLNHVVYLQAYNIQVRLHNELVKTHGAAQWDYSQEGKFPANQYL